MKETRIYKIVSNLTKTNLKRINKLAPNETGIKKSNLINSFMTNETNLLLKDKESRAIILSNMTDEELKKIYIDFKDVNQLIEKSFKDGKIEKNIYQTLGIEKIVDNEDVDKNEEKAIELVQNTERFYELLDYQFIIKQKILSVINGSNEIPRVLVHMPTGTGKTKTSMHTIISHYLNDLKEDGIIIWMAHTDILLQQAFETMKNVWMRIGKDEIKAFRHYGNNKVEIEDIDNGIVFAGFQKLISTKKNNPSLFEHLCQRCRLVIVDEAHKSTANETKKVIDELLVQKGEMLTRGLIGLTATPGRTVGEAVENEKLVNMYENKIIGIDTNLLMEINKNNMITHFKNKIDSQKDVIRYLQDRKILAKIKRESLDYGDHLESKILKNINKKQKKMNEDFNAKVVLEFGKLDGRNKVILEKLEKLNNDKKPTIVFACSVEHGKLISKMLDAKNIQNVSVYGEMKKEEKEKSIRLFKNRNNDINIIINYEVLTTGFDSTNIKCVFITRPTKSIVLYSQMLGRGLRGPQMGGNEECLLIDIEDNLNEYTSESMAFEFFNNYWNS